jgi:hypothetical protein
MRTVTSVAERGAGGGWKKVKSYVEANYEIRTVASVETPVRGGSWRRTVGNGR